MYHIYYTEMYVCLLILYTIPVSKWRNDIGYFMFQGRTLSYKTFFVWVLVSIYAGMYYNCISHKSTRSSFLSLFVRPGYVVKQCHRMMIYKIIDWHRFNRFSLR